ncbi:MAG TPA: alpha/beta hydrolase [Steroidobacteraceae bacterium]|nr:alpha/beta hydrolase [Steroidobacteraceae bacterium]
MKAILYAGLVAAALYALICLLVYLTQDRLLYLPTRETAWSGAHALRLECRGAVLKVWELHGTARPALLYFGGNAEDVGASLADFDAAFPDRAVYLVNYRGYGGSTGQPSEAALTDDAVVLYDLLSARHSPLAVIGRSLGSGVAVALAARRPVERLVLVTPFDSIAAVAADHFPYLPVRLLVRDRYDSRARITQVRAPILIVVAERDEVVWRGRSDALIAALPPPLRHVVMVPGASHNDIGLSPRYSQALRAFL